MRENGPTKGWDVERTLAEARRVAASLGDHKPAVTDPWLNALRYATALLFLLSGVSLTFGPPQWRSAGSFSVIALIPHGVIGLGVLMLTIGIVLHITLIRNYFDATRVVMITGAVLVGSAGFSFFAAAVLGKLTGGTGPWFWLYAAFTIIVQSGRLRRNV